MRRFCGWSEVDLLCVGNSGGMRLIIISTIVIIILYIFFYRFYHL